MEVIHLARKLLHRSETELTLESIMWTDPDGTPVVPVAPSRSGSSRRQSDSLSPAYNFNPETELPDPAWGKRLCPPLPGKLVFLKWYDHRQYNDVMPHDRPNRALRVHDMRGDVVRWYELNLLNCDGEWSKRGHFWIQIEDDFPAGVGSWESGIILRRADVPQMDAGEDSVFVFEMFIPNNLSTLIGTNEAVMYLRKVTECPGGDVMERKISSSVNPFIPYSIVTCAVYDPE